MHWGYLLCFVYVIMTAMKKISCGALESFALLEGTPYFKSLYCGFWSWSWQPINQVSWSRFLRTTVNNLGRSLPNPESPISPLSLHSRKYSEASSWTNRSCSSSGIKETTGKKSRIFVNMSSSSVCSAPLWSACKVKVKNSVSKILLIKQQGQHL